MEPVDPVRDLGVEEPSEPDIQRTHGRLDQPALGGQERGRAPRLKQISGAEPLDHHADPVGVVAHLKVLLVRRDFPLNKAAVAQDFQHAIGEKVFEASPQIHLIEANDPRNRTQVVRSLPDGGTLLDHPMRLPAPG